MIKGLGVSAGIAMGEAYVIPSWEWELPDEMADVNDLAFEFERLYEGIRSSKNELELIKQKIKEALGKDEAFIFDAHLAILEDPAFMNEIQTIIARQSKAAEVAVKEVIDKFVDSFSELDDEYMKERAMDIKDGGNRLLKHLLGDYEEKNHVPEEPYILVAKELTPSQLTNLDPDKVLGIVTMLGGATSHSAILSRALSIPFVMGLEGKLLRPIQQGDFLIIDGEQGELYIDPDESIKQQYRERKARFLAYQEKLQEIAHVSSVTRDGLYVKLEANINAVNEIDQAIQNVK
ncbi:phosphoenolpyruvate-utilizing N-terminal domain-containing protein [Paenibacillus larvae]